MGTTFNRTRQTRFRQHLRTHSTRAEIVLWLNLKGRQILGYKFRRQHGVGRYVLDFYCPELNLAIEIDGASHQDSAAKRRDARRQSEIERHGIRFVRLTDDEVLGNVESAVRAIEGEVRRVAGGRECASLRTGPATTPRQKDWRAGFLPSSERRGRLKLGRGAHGPTHAPATTPRSPPRGGGEG